MVNQYNWFRVNILERIENVIEVFNENIDKINDDAEEVIKNVNIAIDPDLNPITKQVTSLKTTFNDNIVGIYTDFNDILLNSINALT